MSNDLKFLNAYSEVMHENVSSIIKQNFIFQTQLKLAEEQLAILEDCKKNVDKLSVENRQLQERVFELTSLTSSYKNVSEDKSRLQVSLNETSQIKNQMQATINELQQENLRLKTKLKGLDEVKSGSKPSKKTEKQAETTEGPANTF